MLDFLIVGSGLTGATIARELHDAGKRVLVVERRDHVGGNVHDFVRHGIRVHTYGPHYFRTNNDRLWEWVNRFSDWYRYEAIVGSKVGGTLFPWPIPTRIAGQPALEREPRNFEEACLTRMSRDCYERFVKGYTAKQWGVDPITLDASLADRFPIREGTDRRLVQHKHQGIPVGGYSQWTEAILEDIPVLLGEDWLRTARTAQHVVFTGPIDELYRYDLGRLAYRGQKREHTWHRAEMVQRYAQVNNPGRGDHIRTLEWRQMMSPQEQAKCHGTITTTETPFTPDDPNHYEYPFPDTTNRELYQQYRARADADPNLTVCGRLGEYRYYDMDQAIGRALVIARRLGAGRAVARAG